MQAPQTAVRSAENARLGIGSSMGPPVGLYIITLAPRSVTLVRPFLQQEVPCCTRHAEQKLPSRRFQHPLLHLPKLNLQYFFELCPLQRMENHHLVQPVHEFRRKFSPRGLDRGSFDLLI